MMRIVSWSPCQYTALSRSHKNSSRYVIRHWWWRVWWRVLVLETSLGAINKCNWSPAVCELFLWLLLVTCYFRLSTRPGFLDLDVRVYLFSTIPSPTDDPCPPHTNEKSNNRNTETTKTVWELHIHRTLLVTGYRWWHPTLIYDF